MLDLVQTDAEVPLVQAFLLWTTPPLLGSKHIFLKDHWGFAPSGAFLLAALGGHPS